MAPPVLPRELVYLGLDALDPDETFRLREAGDVSSLAQSIAQVGQLFPVEVRLQGGRYQLITGFRRLEALRMLLRKRILARVHVDLSEQEAALLAAADAIDSRSLELEELRALEALYRRRAWATPALEELIGRAIEKAEERIEDIEAALRGEPPPDRSVEDEDARPLDEEAGPGVVRLEPRPPRPGPPEAPPAPAPLGGPWAGDPEAASQALVESLDALNVELARRLEAGGGALPAPLRARLAREAAACRALSERLFRELGGREAPIMEKSS